MPYKHSRINVWAGVERPFKKTFFFWIKLPCIPLYSSFFTNCSYPKIIFLLINLTIKSGTLQTLQEFVYFFLWFWELVFWSRMNICYIYRNHSTAWNTKEDKQILLSIEIRLLIKKNKIGSLCQVVLQWIFTFVINSFLHHCVIFLSSQLNRRYTTEKLCLLEVECMPYFKFETYVATSLFSGVCSTNTIFLANIPPTWPHFLIWCICTNNYVECTDIMYQNINLWRKL